MDKEKQKEYNQLEDILRRWKEYREGLFKSNEVVTRVGKNSRNTLENLRTEVRAAIRRLPNNKMVFQRNWLKQVGNDGQILYLIK